MDELAAAASTLAFAVDAFAEEVVENDEAGISNHPAKSYILWPSRPWLWIPMVKDLRLPMAKSGMGNRR